MHLPDVFGLILCDRLDVNPQIGQTSLVGIFQALDFSGFPSPPCKFVAYSVLYDGDGEGITGLRCTCLETEKDVHSYQRWLKLPGRGLVLNLKIPITKCVLPAPSRYGLTLRFDNLVLAQRLLDVFRL